MKIDPKHYAAEWADAWNDHDIERVLAHFHEDAVFSSPFAGKIVPESGGRLAGKGAIRDYWTVGIRLIPNLYFTIEEVFVGVDHIVILYKNQKGVRVSELLKIEDGLVVEGHGTYPADVVNPTGATG